MKLTEITERKEEEMKGTYAGVRFSESTTEALKKYIKENKIPNPVSADKFHTTLLYSRKYLPNYKPAGEYSTPMFGKPENFEIWQSQPDENGKKSNCLVLRYSCPELYQRHHKLMLQHGATYDYDEYKTHVTLSYDVGDIDVNKLPQFEDSLEITEEYYEDLNLNWARDNAKRS